MAVAVTLRQRERFLKPPKRPKGMTPLEATAATYGGQAPTGNVSPPEHSGFIFDPADLAPLPGSPRPDRQHDLVYQREKCYAIFTGYRFEQWLIQLAAEQRVPLDDCLRCVTLLTCYVEAFMLAAATWPDLYALAEPPQIDSVGWTEGDAAEMGLSVQAPPRRRERPAPALVGCHGTDGTGSACLNLRRYGEKFCPACRSKELEKMRQAVPT